MKINKSHMVVARFDPQEMAKLESMAKDAGINRSEMLRRLLSEAVKVGRVNWDTGAINLVEADGTVIRVEQTPEELAARE